MNATKLLRLIYDVAIKVRLIREHQKGSSAGVDELTDRELLALEVVSAFGPINESQLGRALGLQTSSLADLIARLLRKGLVDKGRSELDQRQRPLKLTEGGRETFDRIKRRTSQKYWFLFQGCIKPTEVERFIRLLERMNKNVDQEVNRAIFDRLPEQEDLDVDRLLGLPSFVTDARQKRT